MKIKDFPYKPDPDGDDKLLLQVAADNSYQHIKYSDLSRNHDATSENSNNDDSANNNTSGDNYIIVDEDTTITNESIIICNTVNHSIKLTIETPAETASLQVINYGEHSVFLDFGDSKLEGQTLADISTFLKDEVKNVQLVYVNPEIGWLQLPPNAITKLFTNNYSPGMSLLLQGSFNDSSNNNNHAIPIGTSTPEIVVGIDNQSVMRFHGNDAELDVPYFLSNTTSATLYCVYTASNEGNYNLVRTIDVDDYWRFVGSDGYFGTFLSNRIESYPSSMPSEGSHLVSVHAGVDTYEVLLNNQSQGVRNESYNPGDRFRIATNDKRFKGDIALILCYPFLIQPSTTEHQTNIAIIANKYPSLNLMI